MDYAGFIFTQMALISSGNSTYALIIPFERIVINTHLLITIIFSNSSKFHIIDILSLFPHPTRLFSLCVRFLQAIYSFVGAFCLRKPSQGEIPVITLLSALADLQGLRGSPVNVFFRL